MHRSRGRATIGASLVALVLASAPAHAQAVPPAQPGPCDGEPSAVVTGAVMTKPQRGWQMQGREVELGVGSAPLPADGRPIVCMRWQLAGGGGPFMPVAPVRVVQTAPARIAFVVPDLGSRPPRDGPPDRAGVFTSDNAAPIADIRAVLVDAQGKTLAEAMTSVAVVASGDFCNVPRLLGVDSGIAERSASKAWQPPGGEIQFIARTSKIIPSDAPIYPCIRWKLEQGDPGPYAAIGPYRVLDRQPSLVNLAATMPNMDNHPSRISGERVGAFAIPYLFVPLVDLRILLLDNELNPIVDAWTQAGVTRIWIAAVFVFAVLAIAFVSLWRVCCHRFEALGRTNPVLCLITTRRGFASLSQFQIMLWTFVVVGSAAYVISLSGDLIPITTGTLVLLGISGTATVIAKVKSENAAATAPVALDPAAAAAEAKMADDRAIKARAAVALAPPDASEDAEGAAQELEAKAKAAQAKADAVDASVKAAKLRAAVASASDRAAAEAEAESAEAAADAKRKAVAIAEADAALLVRMRHPRWSDLVMEEVEGRELDVTRVQMLYFTLVTAGFVLLKVVTSYEIPDIPEGFLILMGISNSVYVGSKFANNPNAK